MITGADIRQYRKELGLTQRDFAEKLCMSQAALSLIEKGRTALSEEHLRRLAEQFGRPEIGPSFDEFVRRLDEASANLATAIDTPGSRHQTLTVWQWSEDIDLSRPFKPTQAAGLVTVGSSKEAGIAFRMSTDSAQWAKGDVLVFESCRLDNLHDGSLCLVQLSVPKTKRGKKQAAGAKNKQRSAIPAGPAWRLTETIIALAHIAAQKRGRSVQFEPLSPRRPIIAFDDERFLAIFRAVYRGQYLT